ncbi:MAG: hypothetical protein J6W16_01190 [Methanobrevibacter sp.]|nr:hypothetical protein [Methanobrevibacter sp.]
MDNVIMYRLARKSTKIFNSYITSCEGFNVPGFGIVRFCHPISTASFTDNAIEILKKTYVGRVIASILENLNNIDYYHHIDSIVDGNLIDSTMTKFFFDVKDVEDKNTGTGNYSISTHCQDYFKKSNDNYWLAFKLNRTKNGGKPCRLNAFVCVKAYEVVVNCSPISNIDDNYLFSLKDIVEKCSSKFFVGDRNDLDFYKKFSSNSEIDWSFVALK